MTDTPPTSDTTAPDALQSPGLIAFDPAVQFNRTYPPCCRTADKILSVRHIKRKTAVWIIQVKDFSWALFTELRKELVELQKIRSQIIGFKITFVSAGVALITANIDKVSGLLLVVPAVAAVFFDFLIHSYSFSIKRTGAYCREYLEPILRVEHEMPIKFLFWEEFMNSPTAGRNIALWGNLGITILVAIPAVIALCLPFTWSLSAPVLAGLAILIGYDYYTSTRSTMFEGFRSHFLHRKIPLTGVAVLILKGRKVLLVRRRFDPAKGKLDIIGGFIEPGESAEEAAVREAREETDLRIRLTGYLGALPDVYGDEEVTTMNIGLTAEIAGGDEKAQDDAAALIWCSLDALPPDMAFAHQRQSLERCRDGKVAKWNGCGLIKQLGISKILGRIG